MDHKEWFLNCVTANYYNNKTVFSNLGYDLWMPMRASYTAKHISGKVDVSGNEVNDYGVNYISYESIILLNLCCLSETVWQISLAVFVF